MPLIAYVRWVSILMRLYSDRNEASEIMKVAGRTWTENKQQLQACSEAEAEELAKRV